MRFPFVVSDKVIYAVDGISRFALHFVIELRGRLHQSHLAQAIELALNRSPILKSVARLRPLAPYWEVVEDLTSYPIFRVEDLSQQADAQGVAQDVIDRYVNEPIDITRCPPARFLLIRLAEERWVFVVKVHHCALDPVAIAHLVEDIQQYYSHLLWNQLIPPPGPMEDRSRWPLFKQVSPWLWGRMLWKWMFKLIRYWRQERRGQRAHVRFSAPNPNPNATAYRSVKFKADDYVRLRRRAQSLGVTPNVLFTAALCRAIHQWNGDQEGGDGFHTIVMPVDMRWYVRRRGRTPRIMSNYVGGTLITVPVAVLTNFERAAQHVAQEVNFIKQHHIGLRHNLLLPLLYVLPPRWLRRRFQQLYARHPGRFAPTAVLAYMGKAERLLSTFPDCAITGLEGIGAGFYPVGFDVMIVSYGKEYIVTFSYPKGACTESEMEAFLKLFSQELLAEPRTRKPEAELMAAAATPEVTEATSAEST